MTLNNQLSEETSPYLLQHADNPVHWQAWSEASLAHARESNKPVLLSIGYSACHWCHVMAHESFENTACAKVMNQHFVNIKVDREERPDLDKTYQLAHQIMTQQAGGWPLTVFLDPHTLLPFYSGTYFPLKPRYQLPGFVDLLLRVSSAFEDESAALEKQGVKLSTLLQDINAFAGLEASHSDSELITRTSDALEAQYDARSGGFGAAPKFPMPSRVRFLMQQFRYKKLADENNRGMLEKVMFTLTKMARGGIYDHLGGGFYRYSTDAEWTVPHFEKMLYDNGELLMLYSDALQFGPDILFSDTLRDTADWMIREMQLPEGGYCAAIDADSEAEEGKFYVWLRHKVKALLSEPEYALIEMLYALDKPANFENQWIFRRTDAWRSVVERLQLDPDVAMLRLQQAKNKLLVERERRIAPNKDAKVLATWNGLAIKGMLRAAQQQGEQRWLDSAYKALDFVQDALWNESDNRLFATWTDGKAKFPAYLDDYANLIDACLMALATRWRDKDVIFVNKLADAVIEWFFDQDAGGFFFTAHDHEKLIFRPKPSSDEALSPGNAVLAQTLVTLGHLFANQRYLDIAEQTLKWAKPAMEQTPSAHVSLVSALQNWINPPELIVIRGPLSERETWLRLCRETYSPDRLAFFIAYDDCQQIPNYLPKLLSLEQKTKTTAYICQGLSCSLPIQSLDELREKFAS